MRAIVTLLLVLISVGSLAETQSTSARRILPADIEQASIRCIQLSTNSYAVKFTYTEAGAMKALAIWETDSKHPKMSVDWRAGWLKRRMDKCFFQNEGAADSFMKSITSK